MLKRPFTVAWISDFPVEWLGEVPEPLRHLPKRHPATWQMVLLSEFQRDPALRVHVILFRGRIERDFSFEQNGAQFHVLKCSPWLRLATVFWADTLFIRGVCRRIKPDLVHAWGMEKGAGLIGLRLGRPNLLTVQGLFGWYKERLPLGRYERFIERLDRYTLRRVPVVTTESTFAVRYLQQRYPRLRVQQAEHAPNRAFLETPRRPQNEPVHFCTVGGLGHRKGTDLLFKALDRLAPELSFRLIVVTDLEAGDLNRLQAGLSPAMRERTQFKLNLLPHQVAREVAASTMLLLPTRADTSPNAVKEAAVAGVPVVASDLGGIPDYIQQGQNGLLFPAGDLDQFVAAIRAAVRHPLFGCGQVEPAALLRTRDYLSPERMARNFLAAYELASGDAD